MHTCSDINYPTDFELLNEGEEWHWRKELSNDLFLPISPKVLGRHIAPLNTDREKARFSFLTIAKQKKPRLRKIKRCK